MTLAIEYSYKGVEYNKEVSDEYIIRGYELVKK